MFKKVALLTMSVLLVRSAIAQAPPNVFDVLMNSALSNITVTPPSGAPFTLSGALPSVFGVTGTPSNCALPNPVSGCFTTKNSFNNFDATLNASIATALSTIPIASPASGVIVKLDPTTGAELPASSTLGPIFTERAETIGKHKLYVGVSNQDFHFKSLNGGSLNNLTLLDRGGVTSSLGPASYPASYSIGMDVRLSQNMAFLTYGVTDRIDVSIGLPIVHAAVQARTYNGIIYVGTGWGAFNPNPGGCWCTDTFTPGAPPGSPSQPNGQGLTLLGTIGRAAAGKTGFGDMLLRFKGTIFESSRTVVAVGTDLRLPTGDALNYLGTGATAVKPFLALSLYSKPLANAIVFSPHFNVGWQFAGKSVLGGLLQSTPLSVTSGNNTIPYFGTPFTSTKGFLPDVFSWAGGTEIAVGKHNTVVVDFLGNEIGWIHGMPNMISASISGYTPIALTAPMGAPVTAAAYAPVTVHGIVPAPGLVSFGQYSGAFGYKVRVVGNLVAAFDILLRFDNNGLTARMSPFYSLSYTFR